MGTAREFSFLHYCVPLCHHSAGAPFMPIHVIIPPTTSSSEQSCLRGSLCDDKGTQAANIQHRWVYWLFFLKKKSSQVFQTKQSALLGIISITCLQLHRQTLFQGLRTSTGQRWTQRQRFINRGNIYTKWRTAAKGRPGLGLTHKHQSRKREIDLPLKCRIRPVVGGIEGSAI